mmetsp:Transcript_25811/g.60547  ORF Transcript_25811/g.60547 Transcript_25811/m.60547 type:complete len:294 (+) Transcript_25811:427-1308(+)
MCQVVQLPPNRHDIRSRRRRAATPPHARWAHGPTRARLRRGLNRTSEPTVRSGAGGLSVLAAALLRHWRAAGPRIGAGGARHPLPRLHRPRLPRVRTCSELPEISRAGHPLRACEHVADGHIQRSAGHPHSAARALSRNLLKSFARSTLSAPPAAAFESGGPRSRHGHCARRGRSGPHPRPAHPRAGFRAQKSATFCSRRLQPCALCFGADCAHFLRAVSLRPRLRLRRCLLPPRGCGARDHVPDLDERIAACRRPRNRLPGPPRIRAVHRRTPRPATRRRGGEAAKCEPRAA